MTADQTQIGWAILDRDARYMFWPMADHMEACKYCEPGAQPVPVFALVGELDKHAKEQGHD